MRSLPRCRLLSLSLWVLASLALSQEPAFAEADSIEKDRTYPRGTALPHTPSPPDSAGGRRRLVTFDLGAPADAAPGATAVSRSRVPGVMTWTEGIVRDGRRGSEPSLLLRDYFEGSDAVLGLIAPPDSVATILFTFGDPEAARGPFSIGVDGSPVLSGLTTQPGSPIDVVVSTRITGDRIRVRILADGCASFALNAASLYSDPYPRIRPPTPLVLAETLPDDSAEALRGRIRACAEYLMRYRSAEGCFSYRGSWYQTSFSIRFLLAAAEILREDSYRAAALACLDRFVEDQLEDGGWEALYFGNPGCDHTPADESTRNLADLGSMAVCLPLAARVDPDRGYLAAASEYANRVVLPNQLASGAFPNLRYLDVDYTSPYSVATGTQAMFLSALFAATGEPKYRDAAERAALFLAQAIGEDGRTDFHAHDRETATPILAGGLNELYYVLEGMFWTARYARPEVRTELVAGADRFFRNEIGLFFSMDQTRWWQNADAWSGSKQAGVLLLVAEFHHAAAAGDTAERIRQALRYLDAGAFGFLQDPSRGGAEFSVVSTALAGLGCIDWLDPDAAFLPDPADD